MRSHVPRAHGSRTYEVHGATMSGTRSLEWPGRGMRGAAGESSPRGCRRRAGLADCCGGSDALAAGGRSAAASARAGRVVGGRRGGDGCRRGRPRQLAAPCSRRSPGTLTACADYAAHPLWLDRTITIVVSLAVVELTVGLCLPGTPAACLAAVGHRGGGRRELGLGGAPAPLGVAARS